MDFFDLRREPVCLVPSGSGERLFGRAVVGDRPCVVDDVEIQLARELGDGNEDIVAADDASDGSAIA
jgi:hypothetical protein